MSDDCNTTKPEVLFARIESLKKWQTEQQQRLREQQSQQTAFLSHEHARLHQALRLDADEHFDQYHNLSSSNQMAFNVSDNNLDESQQEQDYENNSLVPDEDGSCKPKRPFLKKGAGLSRFRMTINDLAHKKPKPRLNHCRKNSEQGRQKNGCHVNVPTGAKRKIEVLAPKTKTCQKNSKSIKNLERIENTGPTIKSAENATNKIPARNEIAIPASQPTGNISNKISGPKAVWTPTKQKLEMEFEAISKGSNTDYQILLAELMEARLRDPAIFDSPSINQSADDSQRYFERELLDELKVFELLEQKASNSSFCSTSSLVTRLMEHSIKSTPKRKLNFAPVVAEEPEELAEVTPKKTVTFAPSFTEESNVESAQNTENESDSESTCSSINSDDVSDVVNVKLNSVTKDASTNTDVPHVNSELLKTRLEQLETELNTFRIENARVSKLKSDLETETRNFVKRKRHLEKEVEEQKHKMTTELQEEKAKLSKDRFVYERYARELRDSKTLKRKEREEINDLKSQISVMTEEHKTKESRWGTSHARLRNQLRQLEKENAALRTEANELRMKNSKLETSYKQAMSKRPSDTKMLHEINKNLTKLAQETKLNVTTSSEPKGNKATVNNHKKISQSKALLQSPLTPPLAYQPDSNKENNRNSLNSTNDSKSTTDRSFESVEREYDKMFGRLTNEVLPEAEASCADSSGKREETLLDDGSVRIAYSNGNVRTISADKHFVVMRYHNGDVKETNHQTGTVKYLYADAQTSHTTFPDGLELLEFPNGQTEKRYANGAFEILFPNGCRKCVSPGGTEEVTFSDGTVVVTRPTDGEKILILPNGQKEIHTVDYKRREYPDGTVKLLYPDGVQETRYANGRIRLKDKHGNLVMDSASI